MWKCNGKTILTREILALNPVRSSPKKQEKGSKSQGLSGGWIPRTPPRNVCPRDSEMLVETWLNVVVLYWTLFKNHGFIVVKNSYEDVRTIFSIGLWKEYSQIKLRLMLKMKSFGEQFLILCLLIQKVLIWLVLSLIVKIFSVVLLLTSWGLRSRIERRVEAIDHGLVLLLIESACTTGWLKTVSQQINPDT